MPTSDGRIPPPPRCSVIVCTLPRSGSWLLSEGLWRTEVAGRPEEYLRPDWLERFRRAGFLSFQHRLHQRDRWDQDPAGASPQPPRARTVGAFLREIQRIGTTANGVFALKCHWFQVADLAGEFRRLAGPEWTLGDLFPDVRYVRLIRRDKLRQGISWQRAIDSDRWWAAADEPHDGEDPWHYDGAGLDRRTELLHRFERCWDRYFDRSGVDPLVVTYEELATAYADTVRRVLHGVGLSSGGRAIPVPRLRKQADARSDALAARHPNVRRAASANPGMPARPRRVPMRTSLIVVDNFYANPTAVREYALKQRYYYPYQPDVEVAAGRRFTWMSSWFRSAADCPFKSSLELIGALEELTGDCVDLDHWNRDFPVDAEGKPSRQPSTPTSCLWNCSFHFKPDNGQELGEGVHNHVVDQWNGVGEDGWAGLIYLSPDAPVRGGLKLWRNVDPTRNYDWMTPPENWELIDDLGNVPNRLLLCRGSIPHSGARGWGTCLADGRLYQTFFFQVRPRQPGDGVLAPV